MSIDPAPSHFRPSRLEVVLSAVIWPGIGQMVQTRWLAGGLFIVAALIPAGFLLAESVVPAYVNLMIVLEMYGHNMNDPLVQPSIAKILISIGVLAVVYFISIADAVTAYRKRLRRWQQHQREVRP
jgi:hypothetical protein